MKTQIYCKNKREFREVQKVLLSQGYKWQSSGEKIIELETHYFHKDNVVIELRRYFKLLRYERGIPQIIEYSKMVSAENYLNGYVKNKNKKVKHDIIKWIDKEFDIKL